MFNMLWFETVKSTEQDDLWLYLSHEHERREEQKIPVEHVKSFQEKKKRKKRC